MIHAQDTLLLPVNSGTAQRYSRIIGVLDDINANRIEQYSTADHKALRTLRGPAPARFRAGGGASLLRCPRSRPALPAGRPRGPRQARQRSSSSGGLESMSAQNSSPYSRTPPSDTDSGTHSSAPNPAPLRDCS
ncbi:hypothetical protein SNARM312S_04544 [Streptomyces narbonensis]